MKLLLVTFALRNTTIDYDQFFVALRGNALQWLHYIPQTVLVATTYAPSEYANRLIPYITQGDSLLVAEIKPYEFQGWLPKEAWDWLHQVSNAASNQAPALPPLPLMPKQAGS